MMISLSNCFTLLLLASTASVLVVQGHAHRHQEKVGHSHQEHDHKYRKGCVQKRTSSEEKAALARSVDRAIKKQEQLGGSSIFARSGSTQFCVECINIDTYFFIFQSERQFVTDPDNETPIFIINQAKAQEQFDLLVQGFRGSPFTFTLKEVKIIQNEKYYNLFSAEDDADTPLVNEAVDWTDEIGEKYRVGGWEVLNCYFGNTDNGSFATTPASGVVDKQKAWVYDGVHVDLSTMPGVDGREDQYSTLGTTLIHEVGYVSLDLYRCLNLVNHSIARCSSSWR